MSTAPETAQYLLEVEPLDLGEDVRAVGLDLTETDENREPVRGPDAALIWARVLTATTADEPWALDFFSHLDRLRDYCARHQITFREATQHSIVIPAPAPAPAALEALLDRFQGETFGARAGAAVTAGDAALEGELARRGVDAYHKSFPRYFFCAVCNFEDGSLVFLSEKLWASEVIRRIRPALAELPGIEIDVRLPTE
jgi:hypothetical protein